MIIRRPFAIATSQTLAPAFILSLFLACGGASATSETPLATPKASATSQAALPQPGDSLGEKPILASAKNFVPPVPVTAKVGGLEAWIVSRRTIPLVTIHLVTPIGSSSDPLQKAGLANLACSLMTEGTKKRSADEFAQAVEALGAQIDVDSRSDYAAASLTVLRDKLPEALALFSEMVREPRFADQDFQRIRKMSIDDVKSSLKEPKSIAQLAAVQAFYGAQHPYGRAISGTTKSLAKLSLGDIKAFHGSAFSHPDMKIIAVGDLTSDEFTKLWEEHVKLPAFAKKAPGRMTPSREGPIKPRTILVVREDATQSMLTYIAKGPSKDSPTHGAELEVVNTPLGGGFTSILNQDLRETRGLSYGAGSLFVARAGDGYFSARAAVFVDKTGEAAKALLDDIDAYAQKGPSEDDVAKARKQIANDVQTYESTPAIARRLAGNVGQGLGREADVDALRVALGLPTSQAVALSNALLGRDKGILVVVGPKRVADQLRANGITNIEELPLSALDP